MRSVVHAAHHQGFNQHLVEVEAVAAQGLPTIRIIGMGDRAVREAAARVRNGLRQSGLRLPPRAYTVSLAPAELPKDGSGFDLAIAVSLLVAGGHLSATEIKDALFFGEVALDGTVKTTKGVLFAAEAAHEGGIATLFLPLEACPEASLVPGITLFPVASLLELYRHLTSIHALTPFSPETTVVSQCSGPSFDDIVGQGAAKRALVIAVAGRHHTLLVGPPGVGKTSLVQALPSLLTPLTAQGRRTLAKILALSDDESPSLPLYPLLRMPHHTTTLKRLAGSPKGRPGELQIAHQGILFLDELGEYSTATLAGLREPIQQQTTCLIVAATNPCPCGFFGDETHHCRCASWQRERYSRRFSAPLMDRFALHVILQRQSSEHIDRSQSMNNEQRLTLLDDILHAKSVQRKRYNRSDRYNGNVPYSQIQALPMSPDASTLLQSAIHRFHFSMRRRHQLIRVARTIADLARADIIQGDHVAEAIQLRPPETFP